MYKVSIVCGFSGFFLNSVERQGAFEKLRHMSSYIGHRGPNDRGIWLDERVGIAHTRLAVVDLSPAGYQPMMSVRNQFVVAFNGEIYNHLELRSQLESQKSAPAW